MATKPRTRITNNDQSKAPAFSSARKGVPSAGDYSQYRSATYAGALKGVVNVQAWGEQTATERYSGKTKTFAPPKDQAKPQRLGDATATQRASNCDNDHPQGLGPGRGRER